MQEKTESRHMVDILFVLTLFCVFALCALTLVTLGAMSISVPLTTWKAILKAEPQPPILRKRCGRQIGKTEYM